MTDKVTGHDVWPTRAAGLAVLGALLAIAIERIVGTSPNWQEEVWRSSAAFFLAVAGLAFGFTLERLRPLWSVAFALAAGATVALIVFWNGSPSGWSAGTEWRMVAAGLVVAIAAPIFQSARDAGRIDLAPTPIQRHAWTNIILWVAAWGFALLSWLLAQLLAELFLLIGIATLRDLLREGWFTAAVIGAALGGAIGLLRDRDAMLGQFQRVAVTILSVLAPVLAVALVLFVAALPLTGLEPLWETTRATTPILLAVIGGAFVLANAVLGNAPEEEARGRALRWSALALAVVMAPLAIVAAVSTWLRIDQYGFSPDRLWALVFVAIVLAISLTYLWTAIRARNAFGVRIRPANVRLALALCGMGLLLATPLIDFGAISTRDQVVRLQSGAIPAEEFDWAALRFDFGPAGRAALERLAASGVPEVAILAQRALRGDVRDSLAEWARIERANSRLKRSLRVLPSPVTLPEALRRGIATGDNLCADSPCTLFWTPGAREALVVGFPCDTCRVGVNRLVIDSRGRWVQRLPADLDLWQTSGVEQDVQIRAVTNGEIEIRTVPRRQVFIEGKPVGSAF